MDRGEHEAHEEERVRVQLAVLAVSVSGKRGRRVDHRSSSHHPLVQDCLGSSEKEEQTSGPDLLGRLPETHPPGRRKRSAPQRCHPNPHTEKTTVTL
jgi:hypothetical protein